MELRVPISLFLLAMLLTFSDFLAFGQFAYGGATGLVSVVVETSVRASLVFGLFVLVLKAYKVRNLSKRVWFKYFLVTAAICGVPPMTLSVYLNNYVLFHVLENLGIELVRDLPVVLVILFGFLFLPLEALMFEFPRLLLTQLIWQKEYKLEDKS